MVRMPCGHCGRATCKPCYLYATDDRYRARWAPPGADAPGLTALGLTATKAAAGGEVSPETIAELQKRLGRRGACRHEGPILEHSARGCERSHIRVCEFEGHNFDRCIRGPSAKPDEVQSCETCEFWSAPNSPLPASPPERTIPLSTGDGPP